MGSKGHLLVSLGKSAIRIIGCIVCAMNQDVIVLAIALFAAELLGVVEELVDKR